MYEECLTRRGHIPLKADWGNDYEPVIDMYLDVAGLPVGDFLKFHICAECGVVYLDKNEKTKINQNIHGEARTL